MPDGVSVRGLVGDAFVEKAETGIKWEQRLFAREHDAPSILRPRVFDEALNQRARIAALSIGGKGVYAENHLPCAVFIVHGCARIHFVRQIRLVRNHAVDERDQRFSFKQKEKVVAVMRDSIGKFRLCRRLRRGKAFGFHRGDCVQIV